MLNQLNTIKLNNNPHKSESAVYVNFSQTIQNKSILVIDDFLTEGYSIETARNYIEMAGANAIGISWLKTINMPYSNIHITKSYNPFTENSFNVQDYTISNISYRSLLNDQSSALELKKQYKKYLKYNI